MKKPWLSKTLWVNLLIAASAFYPPAQEYLKAYPDALALVFAGVNTVLRLITKDKLVVT